MYPPMDKLTKKAWLQWMDTKCIVYHKFLNDKKDVWSPTRRPPWNNKSYIFRLPEDLTRTDAYNYLYNRFLEKLGSRKAIIIAVKGTEELFQRLSTIEVLDAK